MSAHPLSLEPPFSQRAAAVMAALRAIDDVPDAAAVVAEIARQAPNPGVALAERLRVPRANGATQASGVDPAMRAPLDTLADYAAAEALRAGLPRTCCEHLVLGLIRIADDVDHGADDSAAPALPSARAALQTLIGEVTSAAYERLPRPEGGAGAAPCAVFLCGLPGTGKSTLAELTAARLGLPAFSFDWFLGALTPFGVVRQDNAAPLGSQLMAAALAGQLSRGQGAVLDAGGFQRAERARWQRICESLGARFTGVECVCSDETVHRGRVEARGRDIPGWPATVTWEHVGRMRARWEPWDEPHLVLDTLQPVQASMDRIVDAVSAANAALRLGAVERLQRRQQELAPAVGGLGRKFGGEA
jgi:predicted kinase